MKLKLAIATLGLAAILGLGAGAGLKAQKAEIAKADADDEMVTVVIDLGTLPEISGFNKPEAHYYGTSIDKYEEMHLLNGTYYTANLTYQSASQTIEHIQFLFKENSADKWSNSIDLTPTAFYVYHFNFQGSWTGDNWNVTQDAWSGAPRLQYYGTGVNNITANFVGDVANKSYKATLTISETGFDSDDNAQIFFGKWSFGAIRQSSIDAYLKDDFTLNSFHFKEPGQYDVICYDNYADGGIFVIKKYQAANASVYLVNVTEDVRVYTYGEGGIEAFGSFSGTRLGDIPGASDVSGDLHFQGNDWSIWELPLQIGYPQADHIILAYLNEYSLVGSQTANMLLVPGSAYWFSYDNDYHNDDAGAAIEFLLQAEEYRLAATNESVCNVSSANAKKVVDAYNALSETIRTTYIDGTTVNTLRRDGESGKEYVAYSLVLGELSRISGVALVSANGVNRTFAFDATTIIIVTIIALGAISLAALVFVRRKQENK